MKPTQGTDSPQCASWQGSDSVFRSQVCVFPRGIVTNGEVLLAEPKINKHLFNVYQELVSFFYKWLEGKHFRHGGLSSQFWLFTGRLWTVL